MSKRMPTWMKGFILALVLILAVLLPSSGQAREGATGRDWGAKLTWIGQGYVSREKTAGIGVIIGSSQPREALAQGDEVYVHWSEIPPAGIRQFAVFRFAGEVRQPTTHKSLGRLVEGVGILTVQEEAYPYGEGIIVRSLEPVRAGDWIAPLYWPPAQNRAENAAGRSPQDLSGVVVAAPRGRLSLARGDVVYLDLGNAQGVVPGEHFYVFGDAARHLASEAQVALPSGKQIQAELVVVSTRAETSTARIVESMNPVTVGEKVESAGRP